MKFTTSAFSLLFLAASAAAFAPAASNSAKTSTVRTARLASQLLVEEFYIRLNRVQGKAEERTEIIRLSNAISRISREDNSDLPGKQVFC